MENRLSFDELMQLADDVEGPGVIVDWSPAWEQHQEQHRLRVLRAVADLGRVVPLGGVVNGGRLEKTA